ncbi:MAG: endonuclease domain-containing protein [Bacteroidia bacterium]
MKYDEILAFARVLRKRQTASEKLFWEKVRNRRFLGKKFYRQYIIEHDDNLGDKKFFIADFYCHEPRLIVELDGEIHFSQNDYDLYREKILKNLGFQLVRFDNEVVLNNWHIIDAELSKFFI